jgi:hypothetical protein
MPEDAIATNRYLRSEPIADNMRLPAGRGDAPLNDNVTVVGSGK